MNELPYTIDKDNMTDEEVRRYTILNKIHQLDEENEKVKNNTGHYSKTIEDQIDWYCQRLISE